MRFFIAFEWVDLFHNRLVLSDVFNFIYFNIIDKIKFVLM